LTLIFRPLTSRAGRAIRATPTPQSTIHLKTARDVRVEMAKVYRDARQGRLDPRSACQLVYMLGEVRRAIETTLLEAKLVEYEAERARLLPGAFMRDDDE